MAIWFWLHHSCRRIEYCFTLHINACLRLLQHTPEPCKSNSDRQSNNWHTPSPNLQVNVQSHKAYRKSSKIHSQAANDPCDPMQPGGGQYRKALTLKLLRTYNLRRTKLHTGRPSYTYWSINFLSALAGDVSLCPDELVQQLPCVMLLLTQQALCSAAISQHLPPTISQGSSGCCTVHGWHLVISWNLDVPATTAGLQTETAPAIRWVAEQHGLLPTRPCSCLSISTAT